MELCSGHFTDSLQSCGLVKSKEPIASLGFSPLGLDFYCFLPKRQKRGEAGQPLWTLGEPLFNVVPSGGVLLWRLQCLRFSPPEVFFWSVYSIHVFCFSAICAPRERKLPWIAVGVSEKTQTFLMPAQFPPCLAKLGHAGKGDLHKASSLVSSANKSWSTTHQLLSVFTQVKSSRAWAC